MESLNRFTLEYEKTGFIPSSTTLLPHSRKWIAKRRMEWIGNLMMQNLTGAHYKKKSQQYVVNNLIDILVTTGRVKESLHNENNS